LKDTLFTHNGQIGDTNCSVEESTESDEGIREPKSEETHIGAEGSDSELRTQADF